MSFSYFSSDLKDQAHNGKFVSKLAEHPIFGGGGNQKTGNPQLVTNKPVPAGSRAILKSIWGKQMYLSLRKAKLEFGTIKDN